jgi:L-ascorbate metabolism protein UlaG (beta-lactamase superfamily)
MDLKGLEMTWLGHAAVRFRTADGTVVLVDPWLADNPACPESEHAPDRVDAMFITHGHFDHVGNAVDVGRRLQPATFANFEVSTWLGSRGLDDTTGLNFGGTVEAPGGISATLVNAVHSSGISDADGGIVYGGDAGGWILRFPDGPVVYHAGDTFVFGDLALIGELFAPDVVLLPIGGHYTMDPPQAARAARLIGAPTVVPIHWGTFPLLTGTPDELRAELDGGAEVVELTPGTPVT